MLKRLMPSPLATGFVLVVWLLLNNTVAPAQVLLGVLLGFVLPHITARFSIEGSRIRSPIALVELAVVFLWDVLVANLEVVVLVLGPRARLRPRLVEVPLEVSSPVAMSALAGIISLTPGTVSVELSVSQRILTVHSLRVLDERGAAQSMKLRYERRLLEVFEC
ncbi:MAG: multicomponent K+:H+ antiporter subunit E [Gammaproteobacteria bacterium]|jgi:multicomponent K+:H+ antiporter subunit E